MPGLLDLEWQLSFYGSYHNNKVNVLIHTFFVPTILFTAMVFLATSGPLFSLELSVPAPYDQYFVCNLAFIGLVVYAAYYILLEPVAGGSFSAVMFVMWAAATGWYNSSGSGAVQIAIAIHVLSWIMQFLGHGVFEGRKPALLDNLVQSLVLAPLFVWLHILFALGYRKTLEEDVDKLVQKRLQDLKKKST